MNMGLRESSACYVGMSVLAKICQARTLFATKLRMM